MTGFPLLTAVLLAPICAAVLMCFVSPKSAQSVRVISAAAMTTALALTLYAFFNYDLSIGGMQFTEDIPWIKDLGVHYSLGVDGISLPMLLLTDLIGLAAVYSSWNITNRPKEFYILLMILIAGVIAGTLVSARYGGTWLTILFGFIIITASLNMLLRAKAPPLRESLPGMAGQSLIAVFVSFFSVMLGIGGGTLSVPLLTAFNVPARKAIGTASSIGLIICLPGAISTLIFSEHPGIPADLLFVGKISFLAVFCIVPFSALCAPLGVKINRRINPVLLKRLFGIMMIITGLKMLHSALG